MNTNRVDNPLEPDPVSITERELDCLVDGELSEAERRDLLLRLEREPDGWRRCALAFLGGQCWKQEFKSLAHEQPRETAPASVQPAARPEPARVRRAGWRERSGTLLAMAATFLVAVVLGSTTRHWWKPGPARQDTVPVAALPADSARPAVAERGPIARTPDDPWRMVTLSIPDRRRGGSETVRLPVMEGDHLDDAWLRGFPAAVPADVLGALERTGHQVEQSREYLPIRMNDGRRLVVPVDKVDVHYIGNRAYQ